MIYKKWPAFVLFAVSFIILSISGYQCAGPEPGSSDPTVAGDWTKVVDTNSLSDDSSGHRTESNLGIPGDTSQASVGQESLKMAEIKKQLKSLQNNEGEMGKFHITDNLAFKDLRLGRSVNYEQDFVRIYINLSKNQYNTYQGGMTLAYFGDCANGQRGICLIRFETGSGSDAKYNRWSWYNSRTRKYSTSSPAKSWSRSAIKDIKIGDTIDDKGFDDRQFHAIFEDDDAYGAYILKMKFFGLRDTRDGIYSYTGFGKLYLKMFRQYSASEISNRAETTGDCYNSGAFMSELHSSPPKPNFKCWFTATGPYSCRPGGDLLASQAQGHRVPIYEPPIDITTETYKCYEELGEFSIDIKGAFNTNDLTNLK